MRVHLLILCFCLSCCFQIFAEDEEKKKEDEHKALKVGNLALPSSQQPGPLVSFGENIIEKNQKQLFVFADDLIGSHKYFIDIIPGFLYGITDDFSVFFNIPVAIFKDKPHHSSGLEDIFAQFEYAFYNKEERTFTEQATVVMSFGAPTGSSSKKPPTGFGTPSLFVGTTYNHTSVDWFHFVSYGTEFGGTKNRTKIGNLYFYEFGIGKNIIDLPGWIIAWMVEFNGIFAERNKISGTTDPNTGGNVIYVTPSLWVSSEHLVLQLGAGYAVEQHLFGRQHQNRFLLATNLGWTW